MQSIELRYQAVHVMALREFGPLRGSEVFFEFFFFFLSVPPNCFALFSAAATRSDLILSLSASVKFVSTFGLGLSSYL